jgi:hypothetical protein
MGGSEMTKRRFSSLCIALLFLGYGLSAQASLLVAPNANAETNGSTDQFGVFGNGQGTAITFQWDLAASQLTPLDGTAITGIGFRLPGGARNISSPTTVGSWDLELSGSLNPIGSLNATPANNIASNAVVVYNNSSLVIPANSLIGGAGPNPFFLINFTTPFTYTGGDLLMTVTEPAITNLMVDANSVDALGDTAACFGTSCQAQFYNYPITEFQYSAVPEPASFLLITTQITLFLALLALGGATLKRSPTPRLMP